MYFRYIVPTSFRSEKYFRERGALFSSFRRPTWVCLQADRGQAGPIGASRALLAGRVQLSGARMGVSPRDRP